METETSIARGLRSTDENAQYDAACKRLLSEKIILAWIMKSCLEEFRDSEINEIAENYIEGQPQVGEVSVLPGDGAVIQGMDTEDKSLDEGVVTYDIRFHAVAPASGEQIRLLINLEAQNDFYPGYPLVKRGIYYCSRMLSSQYGREFTGPQYAKLNKVYSIWICMNPPKKRENTITRYRMIEEKLVGESREAERNYDLLSVVLLCLGRAEAANSGDVLKLLDVLFSNEASVSTKRQILQDEFSIPMTQTLESEVSAVCNLSKGVEERGIAKGMEKGMAKGIAKGAAETTLANVRSLMETMGLTMEQSMAALRVPEEDRPKYAAQLREQ